MAVIKILTIGCVLIVTVMLLEAIFKNK